MVFNKILLTYQKKKKNGYTNMENGSFVCDAVFMERKECKKF
jgi:hypothetical protein